MRSAGNNEEINLLVKRHGFLQDIDSTVPVISVICPLVQLNWEEYIPADHIKGSLPVGQHYHTLTFIAGHYGRHMLIR